RDPILAVEVLLDHLGLEAEAEDEPREAVLAVEAQDVHEDRLVADRHHRLRPKLRLLLEPSAEPAAEHEDRDVARRHGADCSRKTRKRRSRYTSCACGRRR